jgi:very-short-patch-repair endonuclease
MPEENLHQGAHSNLFGYARASRKGATEAEDLLWQHLRNRQLDGSKFRRQHPLAGFVADFFCFEAKLVIEVDGSYHDETEQKDYDEGRAYELAELGLTVLRFRNEEVLQDTAGVLERIRKQLGASS